MSYDYVDPYQQAQQPFSQMPSAAQPFQQPVVPYSPEFTTPMPVVGGPLDGLQQSVAGVLNAAQDRVNYISGPQGSMLTYPRPQQPSVIGAALRGALYGLAATLLWRRVRGRTVGRHRLR